MKTSGLIAWQFMTLALIGAAPAASPADRAIEVSRTAATPEDIYGPLYPAVQLAHVFQDNKSFVDLVPRDRPEAIMTAFRAERPEGREALCGLRRPPFPRQDEPQRQGLSLREHIKALWPVLARPPMTVAPGSSSLEVPNAYVVAGGRFREMYYWDSYFTMLGLKADGERPLVEIDARQFRLDDRALRPCPQRHADLLSQPIAAALPRADDGPLGHAYPGARPAASRCAEGRACCLLDGGGIPASMLPEPASTS